MISARATLMPCTLTEVRFPESYLGSQTGSLETPPFIPHPAYVS